MTDKPENPRAFPSSAIDDGLGGMTLREGIEEPRMLGDLLAVIHRDGGHRQAGRDWNRASMDGSDDA